MAQNGLKPGTSLRGATYRIEKVLGQGSFGITYLATAKVTTQGNLGKMEVEAKVAIKEFFMSEVNERSVDRSTVEGASGSVFSNYRKKFRKEAENLSRLEHPNIVKVIDVFDENNTTYYVMEFLEGQNLDDYIEQCGGIGEAEAIRIISELGNALSYMHSQKMLHLDIKPKNIMRTPDGTDYLIDFGLSKQFTDNGEPESSTSIGLGTPGYAPVEQAGYKQDGSFPATLDVYALGATLFKMLTGKRPPEATYILNEGFPQNELNGKNISLNTRTALEKAMAPIKKQRFQSVRSFIREFAEEDTIIKSKPTPKPKPQQAPQPIIEPIIEPLPEPKTSTSYKWIWWVGAIVAVIIGVVIWRSNQSVLPAEGPEQTIIECEPDPAPEPEPDIPQAVPTPQDQQSPEKNNKSDSKPPSFSSKAGSTGSAKSQPEPIPVKTGPTREERVAADRARREAEAKKKINDRMKFGSGSQSSQSGTAPNSGSVNGNSSQDTSSGKPGFSLTGRSLTEWSNAVGHGTGTITVSVRVNRQGKVVSAAYRNGMGDVDSDRNARRSCEQAARASRFSVNEEAPSEQTGTLTYRFF